MWIKLGTEYLNLAHIVRVRSSKSFRNGHEEWVVELEGIVKGELQFFTRYRGIDAEILLNALDETRLEAVASIADTAQASVGTVHDVAI